MGRKRGRTMAAVLAVTLAVGLGVLPSAASPEWCADDTVPAAALPGDVSPAVCDLAGRTVEAHGLRVDVPPRGEGRSLHGLTGDGEIAVQVRTAADGTVRVDVNQLQSSPAEPEQAPRTAAAYQPGGDNFATAAPLAIPNTYMPSMGQTFQPAQSTLEPGEPAPGCDASAVGSVWYRIQRLGSLRRIKLRADVPLALYRGTSLGGLQRAACIEAWQQDKLVTLAPTGTYYVQAAVTAADAAADKMAAHVWLSNAEQRPEGTPPCDSRAFKLFPDMAPRKPLKWRFNAASTHPSLTRTQALRGIKQGMAVVTRSKNDCGMADTVSARHEYLGTTRKPASMCVQKGSDGVNTVAFGKLPVGMLGLACTAWTASPTGKLLAFESDIQLSNLVGWGTRPDDPGCKDKVDVVAVTAHEAAHAFGLDHALGVEGLNQTMSTSTSACNGAGRTLGRGDVIALRKRY